MSDMGIKDLINRLNLFGADECEYKFDAEKDGQKYQFKIIVKKVLEDEDE